MIYYFLPDPGIAGGVKVAFQFLEALNSLGVKAVAALPQGLAPQWFQSSVAVTSQGAALGNLQADDHIVYAWPADYTRLKSVTDRLIFHCQGVQNVDETLRDKRVTLLTCWDDTRRLAREKYGRKAIQVGICVSECFFRRDRHKLDNRVAYMPRRGLRHAMKCLKTKGLYFDPLDGLDQAQVSARLQQAGIYLATSVGEDFGLPALEAMAAGCLVVSVPVLGGMEYLKHMQNSLVAQPEELAAALADIARPENAGQRDLLRAGALATAHKYHPRHHRARLAQLLRNELKELVQ